MLALYLHIRNLFVTEDGQDLIEYALLAGLIALVLVAALTATSGSLGSLWDRVQDALDNAGTGVGGGT